MCCSSTAMGSRGWVERYGVKREATCMGRRDPLPPSFLCLLQGLQTDGLSPEPRPALGTAALQLAGWPASLLPHEPQSVPGFPLQHELTVPVAFHRLMT